MAGLRTIVYVDGFNLYYAIRNTPSRWLNLVALSDLLLPNDDILQVKYFTAPVKSQPDDPNARQRQEIYLRALRTMEPKLSIYQGRFLRNKNRLPLTWKPENRWQRWALSRAVRDERIREKPIGMTPTLKVWKTEEKGSDVNLASHLLIDGFQDGYDLAVVVSNDGDLEFPIRYVREEIGKPVAILDGHPHRNHNLAPTTMPPGSFYKRIRKGPLAACQFPVEMTDGAGTFHRPPEWSGPKKR
jgi:hypothetical protein